MNNKMNKDLDKYYTKEETARYCIQTIKRVLKKADYSIPDLFFIEPSAGSGSFLKVLKRSYSIGFDIAPTAPGIMKADFLNDDVRIQKDKNNIIVGNPPFGKKASLAIDFINKSFDYSDVVCFIVPIQFKKWSVQKQIQQGARLVYERDLDSNSFQLGESDYELRCCLQIWVSLEAEGFEEFKDLRIKEAPETAHDDFEMYQYNCTEQAKKFFDYEWDFAVLRQGWGDFNKRYTKNEVNNLDHKKQWIFFKAKSKKAYRRLKKMDFERIANLNTAVKGFGKADVVSSYKKRFRA